MILPRSVAAAALAAVALATPACGDDEPAYCSDRDALQSSIEGLGDVDLAAGGLTALRDQLGDVEADTRALADSAQDELGPEIDGLEAALASLGDALREAAADPTAAAVSTVSTAVSGVQTAYGELSDAVGSAC